MKVMFDPGHGGSDPGAVANGLIEKELALQTAQLATSNILQRCSGMVDRAGQPVEVRLTRDRDETLSPAERLRRVSLFNPAIFISVHYNAASSTTASGTEIFHSAKDQRDDELATLLLDRLAATRMPSRGVRTKTASSGEDYYYIIRDVMDADTIAILYEGAFLTSPDDAKRIKAGWVIQAAEAIAQAVFDFITPQLVSVPLELNGPAVLLADTGDIIPAIIVDGRMYTPIRAPFEMLGYRVDYDSKTQIATVRR